MYCFFSIRSLYTIFENVSIFKELISIYYWMLSLFSCTTKPKEPYNKNRRELWELRRTIKQKVFIYYKEGFQWQ